MLPGANAWCGVVGATETVLVVMGNFAADTGSAEFTLDGVVVGGVTVCRLLAAALVACGVEMRADPVLFIAVCWLVELPPKADGTNPFTMGGTPV